MEFAGVETEEFQRTALQRPRMSIFQILYGSSCDRSLTTLTGFDQRAFRYLSAEFAPLYLAYTPYGEHKNILSIRGLNIRLVRLRAISSEHFLGLILARGGARGSEHQIWRVSFLSDCTENVILNTEQRSI